MKNKVNAVQFQQKMANECDRFRLMVLTTVVAFSLLRPNHSRADEDDIGYRKSYYEEDDDRIKVSTDMWQYNLGVTDNIRVSGNVVVDAISGATPSGAPPPSKWPYQTFSSLYQTAYQGAYNSQYSQYVNNNQIYVSGGLETYQQLTNGAAAFAQQTAGSIATNSANGSYRSLTNNPSYHGTKVPLTNLHDHRNAFSMSVPITYGRSEITPSFSYSCESDYISFGGSLDDAVQFNNKNTTVTGGWSHNSDSVRDQTLVNWQAKMTDEIFLGLTQLVGPKAYFTVNASIDFEHGYLSDPYRGVLFSSDLQSNPDDPALSAEVRPRHRNSEVLYAAWDQFVTPLNGSYEFSYRFFHDSYGIFANTAELDWHQKIGKQLVISPMFRYYIQSAADFYYTIVPDGNGAPTYYSSDYRLSEMETFATGVTLTWRFQKHLSIDFSYMRYIMQGLDGVTSQSAYPSANVFSLGGRFWF